MPRVATGNIADWAQALGAGEHRLMGSSTTDLRSSTCLELGVGRSGSYHSSDTESLHDPRHSDTMVMNTAQMSRQID